MKIYTLFLTILSLLFLVSCENEFEVKTINFNYSTIGIPIGQSLELAYSIEPSTAINKRIVWSSTNPSVATVSNKGVIQALSIGETIVSATANNGVKTDLFITTYFNVLDYVVTEIEPNNSKQTAMNISTNGTLILGFNSTKSDLDFYSLQVEKEKQLFISFISEFQSDLSHYEVFIYYEERLLASTTFDEEYIMFDAFETGRYYVLVRYSENSSFTRGEYYYVYFVWF